MSKHGTQAQTDAEVLGRLTAMNGHADVERSHAEADMLLLDALLIAGKKDIVDAFMEARESVGFWYA